jgi:hypothetical protein
MHEPTRYETLHALLDEAMMKKIEEGFAKFPEPASAETVLKSGTRMKVTVEIWPTQETIDQARRAATEMLRREKYNWN